MARTRSQLPQRTPWEIKAVRTLTFTKQISGFVITLAAPLEAEEQPTRANVKVTREIPAGATFKVEATNNPFDPSPRGRIARTP